MRLLKGAGCVLALFLALALSGCKEGQPAELIAKVQEAAKVTCGFVPIASTVAAVLDGMAVTGGAATVAVTAAKTVCAMALSGQKQTFLGFGSSAKIEGCWASDPRCQADGTLRSE